MTLTPKQQSAFDLLKQGPEYQRYFFKHTDDIQLFLPLKNEEFFLPQNNSSPVESQDNKGYFSIPYWPALGYLEKVAQKSSLTTNAEVIAGLMNVIRDVTRPKSVTKVDNYHTWYSFVKIISNLPTE